MNFLLHIKYEDSDDIEFLIKLIDKYKGLKLVDDPEKKYEKMYEKERKEKIKLQIQIEGLKANLNTLQNIIDNIE